MNDQSAVGVERNSAATLSGQLAYHAAGTHFDAIPPAALDAAKLFMLDTLAVAWAGSDAPGCRDLVRDRREGILVALRDAEAAARALVELAGDGDLRAQLGRSAQARFEERFTEAAVRDAVRAVYAAFRL